MDGTGDTGVNDGVMSIDDAPYQSLPDLPDHVLPRAAAARELTPVSILRP